MSVEFMVNGELCDRPKGTQLVDLIVELELNNTPVTVKINRNWAGRKDWHQEIQAGDRIDIGLSVPVSCVTTELEN
jgi:sulfur carrier protein ThiS